MQTNSRLFDDFARLASGALGTAQGVKTEMDNLVQQQIERLMANMDLVPREEFDAVKAMVVGLSNTVEEQSKQLAALEKQLKSKMSPRKTASKNANKDAES